MQLAVKTTGDVRRRAIRERYGRRGKSGDPEYGFKSLLNRNLENLSPEQFEKIIETRDASAQGQQAAIAWIAKEKLLDSLSLRARVTGSTPCERQVRDKLFDPRTARTTHLRLSTACGYQVTGSASISQVAFHQHHGQFQRCGKFWLLLLEQHGYVFAVIYGLAIYSHHYYPHSILIAPAD